MLNSLTMMRLFLANSICLVTKALFMTATEKRQKLLLEINVRYVRVFRNLDVKRVYAWAQDLQEF